jgi:hypothetical protein
VFGSPWRCSTYLPSFVSGALMQITGALSSMLPHPVHYIEMPSEVIRAGLLNMGTPEWQVRGGAGE